MLKEERQSLILELLQKNGKVLANELSRHFNVSEDTIRRDLRELGEKGHMLRVHGGGLPHSPAGVSFVERLKQSPAAKAAIARAAVGHIQQGQVIILDGGTTNLLVAQNLPSGMSITVVTNSPVIADALCENPLVEVLLIGGLLFKSSRVAVGTATVDGFRAIRADICFLGICSLHPEVGISTNYFEESLVKQAMISGASEVVALASVEKLDTASAYIVAPISSLTHLISEKEIPAEKITPYIQAGIVVEQV